MELNRGERNSTDRAWDVRPVRSFQSRQPHFSAGRTVITPPTVQAESREELPTLAARILEHVLTEPVVAAEVQAARTLGHKLKRMVTTGGHAWQFEHMHLHEHLPVWLQDPLTTMRSLRIRVRTDIARTRAGQQAAPFFGWLRRTHLQTPVVAVFLFTLAAPVAQSVAAQHRYTLDAQSEALVGKSVQALDAKLTYDPAKQLYQFNKDGYEKAQQAHDQSNPVAKLMAAQVGAIRPKTASSTRSMSPSTWTMELRSTITTSG
jgi:hypothetical protein